MVIIIANNLPPAVRGRLKLWFIEPRANIFVSGIKDSVADGVISYLFEKCPYSSGLLVIKRTNQPPYYKIYGMGDTNKKIAEIEGIQLIFEKLAKDDIL